MIVSRFLLSTAALAAVGLSPAHADVLLSGTYDSATTNANQVDVSATSAANPNQLDVAAFSTLVDAAFVAGTGGTITFDATGDIAESLTNPNSSNAVFADGSVLAEVRRTIVGTGAASGDATRIPISGNLGFGGTQDFGFAFQSADSINAVGITIISRSGQTAADATVTATFAATDGSGSQTVSQAFELGSSAGGDDTFFGFAAPTGTFLTGLEIETPYFTRVDDLGITTAVPEPASLGLLAAGGTLLLGRRRRSH